MHEAEGPAGRVQEDLEGRAGLHARRACPDRQDLFLGEIEVGHLEVEVELLGMGRIRPPRRAVVRRELAGERDALVAAQLHPVGVVVVALPPGEVPAGGARPCGSVVSSATTLRRAMPGMWSSLAR